MQRGLACVDGVWQHIHHRQGGLKDAVFYPGTVSATDGIPAATVSSGRGLAVHVCWVDRIYSPLVTLWVFLGQVLSADPSCRAAVARLIAHRVSQGQSP